MTMILETLIMDDYPLLPTLRVANKILQALGANPGGLSRAEIYALFGYHKTGSEIQRALLLLLEGGWTRFERIKTNGRPRERWFAVTRKSPGVSTTPGRRTLTMDDHRKLAATIRAVRLGISDIFETISGRRLTTRVGQKLYAIELRLQQVKSELEEVMFRDHPEEASMDVYCRRADD